MKKQKKVTSNRFDTLINIAFVIILILVITNLYLIRLRSEKIKEAQEILKEKQRPADLQVMKILAENCKDCYDINLALEELKKQNVNIVKEDEFIGIPEIEFISVSAVKLLDELDKLPALIITGEVNKSEQLIKFFETNGIIGENIAIFTNIKPPYLDLKNNKVVGRVSIINLVDSSCEKCTSLLNIPISLIELGVSIVSEKTYEYDSDLGQGLIVLNEVKRIPAILISEDIDYYVGIKEQLLNVGATKNNGYYALHAQSPPYRNLTDKNIVGLVDLIFLKDESCTNCYDINVNKAALERFGIVVSTENSYDINSVEGKELIEKYKITKAPIIMLSPEVSIYDTFSKAWEQVGSVEGDGWHIMRSPDIIGTYKDLATNQVVEQKDEQ